MNYIQLCCSFCTNSNGCPNSKDFRNKVELYFYQLVLGFEIALFICPKSNCPISNNFCEKSSETFYKRGCLDLKCPIYNDFDEKASGTFFERGCLNSNCLISNDFGEKSSGTVLKEVVKT